MCIPAQEPGLLFPGAIEHPGDGSAEVGVVMGVCALFPPVLAVWGVGGRGGGRQAAHQERGAALRALGGGQRVLERAAGESLRQVSDARLPPSHSPASPAPSAAWMLCI